MQRGYSYVCLQICSSKDKGFTCIFFFLLLFRVCVCLCGHHEDSSLKALVCSYQLIYGLFPETLTTTNAAMTNHRDCSTLFKTAMVISAMYFLKN